MSKWSEPKGITVKVKPNGAPDYDLLDTDANLMGSVTRQCIKQGVGQLLHKHLERGGKVVVIDSDTRQIVLEVVVNPPNTDHPYHGRAAEALIDDGEYEYNNQTIRPYPGHGYTLTGHDHYDTLNEALDQADEDAEVEDYQDHKRGLYGEDDNFRP